NYLPFKLPQSSEEIADPHNMVLDVWSNGGIMALAGLAGICAAGLRPLWHNGRAAAGNDPGDPSWHDPFLVGGLLGYLAVFVASGAWDERIVPLLCAWLCVVAAGRGLFRSEVPAVVCAAAFAALAVHLLGAGGIGMPGITQLLLLFVVLGGAVDPPAGRELATTSRWPIAAAAVAGLALYAGCWFTGLTPVITSRTHMAAAEEELFEKHRPDKAQRALLLAAQADPWSSEPYRQLAQLTFQTWLASEGANRQAFDRSAAWQRGAIDRDPQNFGGYRQLGEMYLASFARTGDKADASAAADALRKAVALYPNLALAQAELAESLWNAGAREAASAVARRARELDAINEQAGHIDKRLPAAKREFMKRLVEDS
ncbi:MAG: tetratricopeptide repeat protein, partial [Deltaproteobacteria bacterium]